MVTCRDLGVDRPSSQGKNKGLGTPVHSFYPCCCLPICSTSLASHSIPVIPWTSQCQLSLSVRGRRRTSRKRSRWWPCEEQVAQGTLVLLLVSMWPQPATGFLSSLPWIFNYPTHSRAASAEVAESNFPCRLGHWGFSKKICVCVPGGRRTKWSGASHSLEESPNGWVPKPCQLHKTCSGTADVCLNIRHYNTHLFGDYRQGTEFTCKIKCSPRTFN